MIKPGLAENPHSGPRQPFELADPAQTWQSALEIPIGHFSGDASKGHPLAPSQENESQTTFGVWRKLFN
jgi:hypothetical protein